MSEHYRLFAPIAFIIACVGFCVGEQHGRAKADIRIRQKMERIAFLNDLISQMESEREKAKPIFPAENIQ